MNGDRTLLLPVLPVPLLFELVWGGDGRSDVRDLVKGSWRSLDMSSLPTKIADTGREVEGRRETDIEYQSLSIQSVRRTLSRRKQPVEALQTRARLGNQHSPKKGRLVKHFVCGPSYWAEPWDMDFSQHLCSPAAVGAW